MRRSFDEAQVPEYDTRKTPMEPRKLFDITCVVGSVYAGDSDLTPREAAFLMIARHGNQAGATFTFPNEDGTLNHITVETSDPDQVRA